MSISSGKAFASHSQYWVVGGDEPNVSQGQPELPSLVRAAGRGTLIVTTGVGTGRLTVGTDARLEPPDGVEGGWDVVGEIDVVSTDGSLWVCDMFGGPAHGLSDLAAGGPGLYRVRMHAKDRQNVDEESTERHLLIAWPTGAPSPPTLLTPLDTYGRYWTGDLKPPEPEADDVNDAVASAVNSLLHLVDTGIRPSVSGRLVNLHHRAAIEARLDDVYDIVSSPVAWMGVGGSPGFSVLFAKDQADVARLVMAEGKVLVDDVHDGARVSFTWAWRVPSLGPDRELNVKDRLDAVLNGTLFPDPAEVVDVRLRAEGQTTEVDLTITGVPEELASVTDAVWAWGMKRLARRATKQPAEMFSWGNYY